MKKVAFTLFAAFFSIQVVAQIDTPKIMGIVLIGNTAKPILDIYVVDSTKKGEFKFDVHTIVLYTDKSTLSNIYVPFLRERRYDSLIYRDYSFGTFAFYFLFQNGQKIKVVANRTGSKELFQKIINNLSPDSANEAEIIRSVRYNLGRIDIRQKGWDTLQKISWIDFNGNGIKKLKYKALTSSKIEIDYAFSDSCLYFKIGAVFINSESWFIDSSVYLLKHERLHFDITEIFARKIRKLLIENIQLKNDKVFIRNEIKKALQDAKEYHRLYDRKTKYSERRRKQLEWERKIEVELLALNQFNKIGYNSCK